MSKDKFKRMEMVEELAEKYSDILALVDKLIQKGVTPQEISKLVKRATEEV